MQKSGGIRFNIPNKKFEKDRESKILLSTVENGKGETNFTSQRLFEDDISSVLGQYDSSDSLESYESLISTSEWEELDNAALEAENTAKKMAEAVEGIKFSSKHSSQAKNEKWYQYWSEEYAREYFFQPSSGKVVWEAPTEHKCTDALMHNISQLESSIADEEKVSYRLHNLSIDEFLIGKRPKKKREKKSVKRIVLYFSMGLKSERKSKTNKGIKGLLGSWF